MRKLLAILVVGLCLSTILPAAAPAAAQTLGVEGSVKDGSGSPIPGLTVYLVHPSQGRSYPRITDARGRFVVPTVPAADEYYLEVYWGDDLMYRALVPVYQYVRLRDIILR